MVPHSKQPFSIRPVVAGILAGLTLFLVSCIGIAWFYLHAKESMMHQVGDELERTAEVAASFVDGDLHQTLTSPSQIGGEAHRRALAPLIKIHRSDPDISYVYTVILREDGVHFVLDTTTNAAELDLKRPATPSLIMDRYPDPDDEMLYALKNAVACSMKKPRRDEFGVFLSGYAPFYSHGKCVGVAGVDLAIDELDARLTTLQWGALSGAGIMGGLSMLMGAVVGLMHARALRHKQQQEKLKTALEKSAAVLNAAQHISHIGSWELDFASGRLERSDEIYRIFEINPGSFGASSEVFLQAVHPEDRKQVDEALTLSVRNKTPYAIEYRLLFPDGRIRHVHERCEISHDAQGQPVCSVGTVQDISEQKRALEALHIRDRAIEASLSGFALADPDGKLTYGNRAFLHLWGFTDPAQFLGRPASEFWNDPAEARRIFAELLHCATWTGELVAKRADGSLFDALLAANRLTDPCGATLCLMVSVVDVTEHKRTELLLRHAQKMEAVGQLAGGVAHDFNNILGAMMLQINLMQKEPGLAPEIRAAFGELEKSTNRAAALTRQLLMFSRRQTMQIQPIELNDVVEEMIKMLRRILGEHIHLELAGAPSGMWVQADVSMMEQVIMNLCVNARDAMPQGGHLTLDLQRVELHDARTTPSGERRSGDFVCLSVADTGIGISQEDQRCIFDPFFTTKDVGKGTGLGLATVYGIVNQHQGWVEVESKEGEGSCFRVFLPACDEGVPSFGPLPPLDPLPGGRETILFVEDDASLHPVIAQGLESLGYTVVKAHDGMEALEKWEQHREQIALLLTDMVMPEGLSGMELARKLKQKNPALQVIISSGYSLELNRPGQRTEPGVIYLAKPYQMSRLAAALRHCLDRKPTA